MARISDYATLVTAVGDYLARADLSGFIPNFIQNCEAKLNRELRISAMETALSTTISSGVAALPADYAELRFAYVVSGGQALHLKPLAIEDLYTKYPTRSASGVPKFIARQGSNFVFGPYPDDTYSIAGTYYAKFAALSVSNTTNWLITDAPDLLLYGALLEAMPFLEDDSRIAVWQNFYMNAFMSVQNADKAQKNSGGVLAVRVG